jgi:2',3'-cyclic-nucleotide 2'-phosphodiesterase/3'-nucleotidase
VKRGAVRFAARHATARRMLIVTALALLITAAAAAALAPKRVQVTILSTADLHGNILPVDYYTNKPDDRGLAKVATLITQARRDNPNVLLLDSGDTIQGSPLEYYHNRKNNAPPDPMMLAMNALRYDAMTVGNHEYNFGLEVFAKARREAKFPWIAANIYRTGTQQTAYDPYLVKEIGGVKIGILGLTTPAIPNWENPPNYAGLEFHEAVGEARKWVAVLRGKEAVDLVVVAMHLGLEQDLRTGEAFPTNLKDENAAVAIASTVPGIDVMLLGHTHREVPSLIINGVLLTQADSWGHRLARVDVYLEKSDGGPRWKVVAKSARTMTVGGVTPDKAIAALVAPYDAETQAWLGRAIGQAAGDLSARESRFRDTAIMDLIQRVQIEAGKADVSLAAPFNLSARIGKGPVSVRDIAGLYIYENTLVVLEVSGQQLKEALEHSAKYFRPYVAGKTAAELVDENIPAYNFDIAEGVTYDLDITRPAGQRIQNLRFRGQPLNPAQKLKLAVNNYRVNGGGGYTMYRDAPVVSRSSEEIRDLIIDWVERHKEIPVEANNNWRLLLR